METKQLKTGTTTIGLITKDAVVLAADMRASMGHLAYDEESKKLYKITAFYNDIAVCEIPESEVLTFDPGLRSFININTADDLARARRIFNASDHSPGEARHGRK